MGGDGYFFGQTLLANGSIPLTVSGALRWVACVRACVRASVRASVRLRLSVHVLASQTPIAPVVSSTRSCKENKGAFVALKLDTLIDLNKITDYRKVSAVPTRRQYLQSRFMKIPHSLPFLLRLAGAFRFDLQIIPLPESRCLRRRLHVTTFARTLGASRCALFFT